MNTHDMTQVVAVHCIFPAEEAPICTFDLAVAAAAACNVDVTTVSRQNQGVQDTVAVATTSSYLYLASDLDRMSNQNDLAVAGSASVALVSPAG